MKNKVLLVLLVIVALFSITGCFKDKESKSATVKKDKTEYTCVKKGIKETSKVTDDAYTKDLKYIAKMDKDKKLLYYCRDYTYYYESEAKCNEYCDLKTDWNNDIAAKNYSGLKVTTKCDCKGKKSVQEISEYDIPNLNKFLRGDISRMNDDDTFRLDEWLTKFKDAGYKCS